MFNIQNNFIGTFQKNKWLLPLCIFLVLLTIGFIYYLITPKETTACFPTGKEKSIRELNEVILKLTAKKPDSLFRNQAALFVNAGKKYRVDPILLLSIAMLETDRGTSSALKKYNNPGGIMKTDNPSDFESFPTVQAGIETMAWTLRSYYLSEQKLTPAQIGPKWSPIDADNDPHQTNHTWVENVQFFVSEFNGLTYQCKIIKEDIPDRP
ncbi:glucosaminidase domain-containing protein [Thermoflavimicrobium daqui]|nr:glucosaminidase domain-containing protein [Thermoflavimicrobium daqui]